MVVCHQVGVAGQSDCSQLCQCGERNRIKSCQPATCGNVHRNCTHQQQVYGKGCCCAEMTNVDKLLDR